MPKFSLPKLGLYGPAFAIASFALAGAALADPPNTVKPNPTTDPNPPVTQPAMPPASPADINAPNGAITPGLKVGMTVNDNTGAAIGAVTELKSDPSGSGKMFATIKMGETPFAVDASSLAVENGVATINLSHDQLLAMVQKPAAPKS